MKNRFGTIVISGAFAALGLQQTAVAQAPPTGAMGASGAQVSPVVANPTYVSIPMEIVVNRPAAEVWKRVGKYCDIGEWLQTTCTIVSGKDGEIGTVRSIG